MRPRRISFDGMQMRTDIAARAVERLAAQTLERERPMEIQEPEVILQRPSVAETALRPRATMPEVEEAFEEIEVDAPAGRDHHGLGERQAEDAARRQGAAGGGHPLRGAGDERPPRSREGRATTASNARMRGLKVIIAGAGMSAALPGVAAAHTDLPVVGVPIARQEPGRPRRAALGGADAARACPSPASRSTGRRTPGCSRRG